MAQDSQNDSNQFTVLEAQIRESFGRVVYTHKTQEKCADIIYKRHKNLKVMQIIISAIVTTSLIIELFGENQWSLCVGVILSALLLAINSYMKDYDLGEIAQKHTNAANELWDIRESYLSLITDIKAGLLSVNQVISKRDDLQSRLLNVYTGSPRTNGKAYKEAQKALQMSEELTFSDTEIDNFLPESLRKNR